MPPSPSSTPPPDDDKRSASDGAESGEAFPGGAVWDDLARLLAGAGQAAEAAGGEAANLWQTQIERLKQSLDLVPRESFDAVAEMAARALEKIAEMEARLAELESSRSQKPGKKQTGQ